MWSWILDPSVSTYGPDIDRLYYIILGITGVIFVATQALLVWFLVRYRHREGQRAAYIHGSTRAEVLWTAGTFIIVLFLALYSRGLWAEIKDPARFPADALQVDVIAKQFEWNVTYPGADGQLETDDDFTVRNQLRVPVDSNIRITLRSEDVIHSFYVPEMRLKQDAVPGMDIPAWFQATTTGQYVIGCAELCGIQHYSMDASFYVHTAAEWQQWNAQQQRAAAGGAATSVAAADEGERQDAAPTAASSN